MESSLCDKGHQVSSNVARRLLCYQREIEPIFQAKCAAENLQYTAELLVTKIPPVNDSISRVVNQQVGDLSVAPKVMIKLQ